MNAPTNGWLSDQVAADPRPVTSTQEFSRDSSCSAAAMKAGARRTQRRRGASGGRANSVEAASCWPCATAVSSDALLHASATALREMAVELITILANLQLYVEPARAGAPSNNRLDKSPRYVHRMPNSLLKKGTGSRTSQKKAGDLEGPERACPLFHRVFLACGTNGHAPCFYRDFRAHNRCMVRTKCMKSTRICARLCQISGERIGSSVERSPAILASADLDK
jgi:hypothetical protein